MDDQVTLDLERFRRESELHDKAQREAERLAEMRERHLSNMKALLRLILNNANQTGDALPGDVIFEADRYSIMVPPEVRAASEKPLVNPIPEVEPDRTEFVKEVISRFNVSGISAAEIRKAARDAGWKLTGSFPYAILEKLVEKGEARKDEAGNYFSTEEGW